MTAIKHTLQRQLFLPCKEELVAVVHVSKIGKKKKASFLCAALSTDKSVQALIYQVKQSDKGISNYKKKLYWSLRELKVLDAKEGSRDGNEFDMQFDKQTFKWVATSHVEKNNFIQCLWKLSQRYLVSKPEFCNVPPGVIEELKKPFEHSEKAKSDDPDVAQIIEADYITLTPKEETDTENIISQCDYAISDAERFVDELSKELSVLDGANVHSIMGSEEQVLQLMELIDKAVDEASKLEARLNEYDTKLKSVKELMEIMRDKDSVINTKNNNTQQLLKTLDGLINSLELSDKHIKALLEGGLAKPESIMDCTEAANALYKCMRAEIPSELVKMQSVQEQQRKFEKIKKNFSKRFSTWMKDLFNHLGNEAGQTLSRFSVELKLPQHNNIHEELIPYVELMLWLKQADSDCFNELTQVYIRSLSKLYDQEIKDFMQNARNRFGPNLERRAPGMREGTLPAGQKLQRTGSATSLNKAELRRESLQPEHIQFGASDHDVEKQHKFDQTFEVVLTELSHWSLAEQDFCQKFFHLTSEEDFLSIQEQQDNMDPVPSPRKLSTMASPQIKTPRRVSLAQKQINEEVRGLMTRLFPSLGSELTNFIAYGDRIDSYNSLYMLVRMGQHVINAEDTGSFLSKTFASCLVDIKRTFDKSIQHQLDIMAESRLSKKGKVGILSFVHSFEEFAVQAEIIFKGSSRRTDLDKSYQKLASSIFEHIQRLANESSKTPVEVVMMENFHHMNALFSRIKIVSLDGPKKESKQLYQAAITACVTRYLGRPMEKISIFFEGVEARLAAGVKAEEIGYQLAYNKQELRKTLKEYPGKEVRKNLENLYKKLDKHLSEEENLLQVVWHSMQDEFLKQYKHFELLISKCYPNSNITLEFTINDVLSYFSDIAQQH